MGGGATNIELVKYATPLPASGALRIDAILKDTRVLHFYRMMSICDGPDARCLSIAPPVLMCTGYTSRSPANNGLPSKWASVRWWASDRFPAAPKHWAASECCAWRRSRRPRGRWRSDLCQFSASRRRTCGMVVIIWPRPPVPGHAGASSAAASQGVLCEAAILAMRRGHVVASRRRTAIHP